MILLEKVWKCTHSVEVGDDGGNKAMKKKTVMISRFQAKSKVEACAMKENKIVLLQSR